MDGVPSLRRFPHSIAARTSKVVGRGPSRTHHYARRASSIACRALFPLFRYWRWFTCAVNSAFRIAANRHNAQKSTGPRTPEDKARSSQNARKHGLTRSVEADPKYAQAIDVMTLDIAGPKAGIVKRERPRRIAVAHAQIVRARRARRSLYRASLLMMDCVICLASS
jgi:hypothetical protein